MKKRSFISACSLAIGLVCPSLVTTIAHSQELKEVKVALPWLRNGQYSALMVADVKGYFAAEGLKLTLIDGGPGRNPIPVVGVGQADFGLAPSADVFSARVAASPVDIIGVGALAQVMPLSYIRLAKAGDPEPTPKDLIGKTVGVQAGGEFFLQALLKSNGIDPAQVKTQTVLANAEPLMMGRVDYFAGFLTNQPYQIEMESKKPDGLENVRGKTWRAIPWHKYALRMPTDVVFTTTKYTKDRPEIVKKFLTGLANGLKFVIEQPQQAIAIVDTYPGQLDRVGQLAWRLPLQNPLAQSDLTAKNGLLWMDSKAWEEGMKFYQDAGKVSRSLPAAEMMTNAFNPGIKLK